MSHIIIVVHFFCTSVINILAISLKKRKKMNTLYALRGILKDLGFSDAAREILGVKERVKEEMIDHKSAFRKKMSNFVLPAENKKARNSVIELINGFIGEYFTEKRKKNQESFYFKNDVQKINDIIEIQMDSIEYDEIRDELRDYFKSKLEKKSSRVKEIMDNCNSQKSINLF